ncbi:MAG: MFS transporter [Nocardioides sp.]|uniref:MFS transporter n=1 Tax=Nocardioides sp. TaxID=35761 RepID=UPI0039E62352
MSILDRLPPIWGLSDFRRFWTATTAALFGSAFGLIVIPLIAALTLDASPADIGLLGFLELLPYLLFGLFAGVWVDRFSRRRVMLVCHLGRFLVLCGIPIAYLSGTLNLPFLLATSFVFGTFSLFFDIAHQAFLPSLLERDELVSANGAMQFSRSAAELSGPGIAGPVIAMVTAPAAVLVNAFSFLAAAVLLLRVRRGGEAVSRSGEPASVLSDTREGLVYVLRTRMLRAIAASLFAVYFFVVSISILTIYYASTQLGLGPTQIGVAYALGSVGTLIGASINSPLMRLLGLGRMVWMSALLSGLGPLLIALATPGNGFVMLIASEAIVSVCGTVFAVGQVSIRQSVTPDFIQGRMNGFMRFIGIGSRAVGSLVAGVVGDLIGVRATLAIGSVGGLLAFLSIWYSPIRRLRTPEDVTQELASDWLAERSDDA